MRVDRAPTEPRETRSAANTLGPDAGNLRASGMNFASRLQQHRQRSDVQTRESRSTNEGEARRSVNRQAVEGRSTEPVIDDEFLPLDGAPAFRTMLTLLSANSEARESATLASGAAWATRRRNAPSEPGASPCIEVTHADGVHFVLSQQDGVWLLSLKDQHAMSAEQLERLVQDLRRHFAERGLGEIDVIA